MIQTDDLEEGEIALSGDSHMEVPPSANWNPDREEGYEEKIVLRTQQQQLPQDELQQIPPKIKRKRSMRNRPRFTNNNNSSNNNISYVEKSEERSPAYRSLGQRSVAQPSFDTQSRENASASAGKQKKNANAQSKKGSPSVTPKSGRLSNLSGSGSADARDGPSKGGWSGKPSSGSGSGSELRMTDSTQRKVCTILPFSTFHFLLSSEPAHAISVLHLPALLYNSIYVGISCGKYQNHCIILR